MRLGPRSCKIRGEQIIGDRCLQSSAHNARPKVVALVMPLEVGQLA